MEGFKVPSAIPQDLLLIQDLVGEVEPHNSVHEIRKPMVIKQAEDEDSIASSDSEAADEDEVEAELMEVKEESDGQGLDAEIPTSSDSESDSDSSSSDSDAESEDADKKPKLEDEEVDDEESGPVATSGTYFQTKNEVAEAEITIPDIEHVEENEFLEKVGEVMSVLPNLAIVKGGASENLNRGSERALDSDTLLVFEDRRVMGYIYETFGPTSQPLYQVKFNKSYPLDPSIVTVSREVFHVPARSNFVFLKYIRALKGSDASNVNDEEPAEHEQEFSDDEAEAAFKRNLKKRRADSRAHSVSASRHSTPGPSQLRDQDLEDNDNTYPQNPYANNGPDDFDFASGPSRPVPLPYDDPYSDAYTNPESDNVDSGFRKESSLEGTRNPRSPMMESHRGQGRGHEHTDRRGRGRGGGRGRGRDRNQHGRGPYERRERSQSYSDGVQGPGFQSQTYSPPTGPFNPTGYSPQQQSPESSWGYPVPTQQAQPFPFGVQNFNQGFVQPHINPRFAAAFGMNLGASQSQPYGFTPEGLPPNLPPITPQWQNNWQTPGQENRGDGDMHPPT